MSHPGPVKRHSFSQLKRKRIFASPSSSMPTTSERTSPVSTCDSIRVWGSSLAAAGSGSGQSQRGSLSSMDS